MTAKTAMPTKRKFSSISPNALYVKVSPRAPKKPGQLKGILKRPSPPSRFLDPGIENIEPNEYTPESNEHKIESAHISAPAAPPAAARRRNSGTVSSSKATNLAAAQHVLPSYHDLDIIEDSTAEAELPSLPSKKLTSPIYEDDGDTEGLIKDSQSEATASDDTHLMSGGLGAGESPYKMSSSSTSIGTSERKVKKQKTPLKTLDFASVPRTEVRNVPLTSAGEYRPKEGAQSDSRMSEVHGPGATTTKRNPDNEIDTTPETALPLPQQVNALPSPPLDSTVKQDAASTTPTDNINVAASPVKAAVQAGSGPLTPVSSKMSRSQRRKATKRQSPGLADVTNMLQQYEKRCEIQKRELEKALEASLARTAQLEAQNGLLQSEFASRSQERQLQYTWHLNKFAVLSRRKYSLQSEEETRVVGGCDDLEEANKLARSLFEGEMTKLEMVVEDLGQSNFFGNSENGVPQVQMRYTACGMVKCRSYCREQNSHWDLTVERVAAK